MARQDQKEVLLLNPGAAGSRRVRSRVSDEDTSRAPAPRASRRETSYGPGPSSRAARPLPTHLWDLRIMQ